MISDKRPVGTSFPEGVTEIGDGAFFDCYKLTSVDIPDPNAIVTGAFDSGVTVNQ